MAELSIKFDQAQIDRLFARLDAATAKATIRPPVERGLGTLQADLATYPAPSPKRQPPKSRAQRIKQILLAKEGKIPYRRTGDLGRSWTTDVTETADGLRGTVGNAVKSRETGFSYGPLVQGDGTQAAYHADNWHTEAMVLGRQQDGILREVGEAIADALG